MKNLCEIEISKRKKKTMKCTAWKILQQYVGAIDGDDAWEDIHLVWHESLVRIVYYGRKCAIVV